ncbi:hypothetical protein M9H77_12597 [Catharanthus roseus]|uniref:Uncharacterized protein n=1 Tax=Catharanthus roseus TaxID=4058 RepID=A0ACC0BI24_CATRO|nr:hypothetical protein M9H77_12597 [Catharanthus roseus]
MDAHNFQPLHGIETASSSSDWSTSSSSSLTVVYNIHGSSETICVTAVISPSLSFEQSRDWDPYPGISIFSLPIRYVKSFGFKSKVLGVKLSHAFTWRSHDIIGLGYKSNGMK